MATDYNDDLQKLFLEMMIDSPESYTRVQQIYNPLNFARSLQDAATFIKSHADKYHTMPSFQQVNAACKTTLVKPQGLTTEHYDWFMDEFESFTKKFELERAIMKAVDHIDKGNFDPVEKIIKDAIQIGLVRDLGTDYFANPRDRLLALKNNNGQISTGWPQLDKLLYGGMSRGELAFFCGGSGGGKSLFLQNIALNWVQMGLHGVIITLELSEGLSSMRLDSMVSGINARDIFARLDDVEMKVKLMGKKSGSLQVMYMPAQSTVNHFRAYLKELQIQTGRKIDFLVIDYLDLMMPASVKIDPTNLFVKDKYVSEEVRNLGGELNAVVVTAAQFNRGAVGEDQFDHGDISGGITKIFTADNVFGILTSRAMREKGKYELQLLKTRSSSGVGQKIELDFDIDTMRISDPGEPAKGGVATNSALLKAVSEKNAVVVKKEVGRELIDTTTGEVHTQQPKQSDKLKNLLATLKKSDD